MSGDKLALGDGVYTPSGNTGKVRVLTRDGYAKVQIATGSQAGQVRRFLVSSLRPIDSSVPWFAPRSPG